MIKIFCDECGKELKEDENRVSDRLKFKSKSGHEFEIICSNKERIWNAGHLCIDCVKKLVQNAEAK